MNELDRRPPPNQRLTLLDGGGALILDGDQDNRIFKVVPGIGTTALRRPR